MSGPRGLFIVLEGGEGAGKTTAVAAVRAALENAGRTVVTTREPGGSPTAEEIRKLVLSDRDPPMSALTETLLMFAARSDHLDHTIRPALEAGIDVVCDRFVDSTFVYQGGKGVRGFHLEALANMVVPNDLRPDMSLLLDVSPEVGMARAASRGDTNRFDNEALEVHAQRRKRFRDQFFGDGDGAFGVRRRIVIDANEKPDVVTQAVAAAVAGLLDSIGYTPPQPGDGPGA